MGRLGKELTDDARGVLGAAIGEMGTSIGQSPMSAVLGGRLGKASSQLSAMTGSLTSSIGSKLYSTTDSV